MVDTITRDWAMTGAPDLDADEEVGARHESANRTSEIVGKSAAIGTLAAGLAACGGGGTEGSSPGGGNAGVPPIEVLKPQTDAQAARFALHASLSVSPQDISNLRQNGYEAWLSSQMDAPNSQTAAEFLASRG